MPYIKKTTRDKYDEKIESIALMLNSLNNNDKIAGELNYVFYRLAILLCNESYRGKRNYARMAVVSSSLSEAQTEFRRRVMAPYEDEKILSDGDIDF